MRRPVLAVIGLLALTACGGEPPVSTSPTTTTVSSSVTTPPPAPTTTPPTTTVPPAKPAPVVVVDPGHNGANAAHPAEINRQVPAGRGRWKACNTTGTATDAGYPEHAFTWDVAVRVRDLLTAQGVRVVLTRPDDNGVGPCVDRRAAIGNESGAAAVVSIHADGATDPAARGFHIAYSAPPLNEAQGEPATRLATTMRDTFVAKGFTTSTYIGSAGLSPRDDLGGLNLSQRPAVLVECGNMRNAAEAATFSGQDGRASYAAAIAAGILAYLG
ncbi:N-acetylmuramoyl-L-alanine amidase [Actinophytocola glycyrrhizae]|uniref:N-acetylmuramoyl-L-alanine amidase n=1 Tax=Actinophytocola glycyrrhizae TaxID=2044873 RepID=A0ABV9S0U0_9PSEU